MDTKFGANVSNRMLQNSRVAAFTVFELLRENQLEWVKLPLAPPLPQGETYISSPSTSLRSNFCFSRIISFANRRERLFEDASLVSDFKLNQENDDLLSSRHK